MLWEGNAAAGDQLWADLDQASLPTGSYPNTRPPEIVLLDEAGNEIERQRMPGYLQSTFFAKTGPGSWRLGADFNGADTVVGRVALLPPLPP